MSLKVTDIEMWLCYRQFETAQEETTSQKQRTQNQSKEIKQKKFIMTFVTMMKWTNLQ